MLMTVFTFVSCSEEIDITTKDPESTTTTVDQNISNNASGNTNSGEADYLDLIYEIDGSYYSSEKNFNHKNIISRTAQISIDKTAPATKKVKINGVEKELHYKDTRYYPISGTTARSYLINPEDDEDVTVLINQDGTIKSVLNRFDKIDISKYDTPEKVLPKVKEVVEEYVDLSKYKYYEEPYYNPETLESSSVGFGIYTFGFYNLVDGCTTDYVSVSVDYRGNVASLKITNMKQSITSLNIDEKLEDEILELKFRDIYTTDTTEYISHKIDESVRKTVVTHEDGTVYIIYRGSAKYRLKSTGAEINGWLIEIVVPLELISSK